MSGESSFNPEKEPESRPEQKPSEKDRSVTIQKLGQTAVEGATKGK